MTDQQAIIEQEPAWVARGPMAQMLESYLQSSGALTLREMEQLSGVSRRMVRKILVGEIKWVRLETADRITAVTGQQAEFDQLDVFVDR
jgi:transcriptional antiterminator